VKYALVVFDWDGTVIDSAATIAQCIQEASRDLGLEVPTLERASHVIGLGLQDSLRIAVPGLRREQYAEFVERYRAHFRAREDAMRVFPGIEALLRELSQGRSLAIATGKSRRGLDRSLAATGLGGYFSASRCADETHPKPHPAMLLELMNECAIEKSETLMIGDTSHDLEMAREAGVDAVAVSYGAHAEEALRACGPRDCLADVASLRRWLSANA